MSNQLIALNDILPTLAGLVGEKLPEGTAKDGHDLLPAFYGNMVDEGSRESVVVRGSGNSYGLRQGKWKVVQEGDAQPSDSSEPQAALYNLEEDPGETKDRFGDEPEVGDKLLNQLSVHLKSTD